MKDFSQEKTSKLFLYHFQEQHGSLKNTSHTQKESREVIFKFSYLCCSLCNSEANHYFSGRKLKIDMKRVTCNCKTKYVFVLITLVKGCKKIFTFKYCNILNRRPY